MNRKLVYICMFIFCSSLGSCGCHHRHATAKDINNTIKDINIKT